jgi:Protein of unknown function VcgC/VcgE (DUF2780)
MNRAVCWVLIVAAFVAPGSALAQAPAGEASSELTSLLAKELGSTTKQAQGAAGSLFRLAKTRMTPENFSKIASAVPAMDQLLAAAPALDAKAAGAGALGQAVGKEGRRGPGRCRTVSRSGSSASRATRSRKRCPC